MFNVFSEVFVAMYIAPLMHSDVTRCVFINDMSPIGQLNASLPVRMCMYLPHFTVPSCSSSLLCEKMLLETASRLKHQDHRLAVRPKMRRPPSTAHLKDLQEREGVSSEIKPRRANTLDSASWSTYLGKRDMDPTAEAGLALKIDFSAVKLRKTVNELREEGEGSEVAGGPSAVVDYCNPSKLLLHVKGEHHPTLLATVHPAYLCASPVTLTVCMYISSNKPSISPPTFS